MNKYRLLSLILLLSPLTATAYDFSATVPSGQTLYFNYVTGGVEVVYPNNTNVVAQGWNGYTQPSGAMTIPAAVSDGSASYAVLSVANYAFHSCTSLTAVTLAEGVAEVGNGAFYNCSGVVSLTLPSSLTSIGNAAFSGFASLTDVWMSAVIPPTTSTSAFYNLTYSQCTLHVPCGSATAYAAMLPWSNFGTLSETNCNVTVSVGVNNSDRGTVLGGGTYASGTLVTLVAQAVSGYCFVCWNDSDTLNPRLVNAVSDTSFTAMFFALQHDTVYLADGDTVTLHDTITSTDTVFYSVTVHDTTILHDTLEVTVHDTITPTFFTLTVASGSTQLGVGVGSAVLPAGSVVEVCGLPLEGARFMAWDDGSTVNPRQVTLTGNMTLRALFEQQVVTEADKGSWGTTVDGRRLTVRCEVGESLKLYDMQGRCHMALTTCADTTVVEMPAAGVWLVQVGDGAARKIVIEH